MLTTHLSCINHIIKKIFFFLLLLQTFTKCCFKQHNPQRVHARKSLHLFICQTWALGPCNTEANLSLPGATTLKHSGGVANVDWSQPHRTVTHALPYSEIRKENKISFLSATSYLRHLLARGTPCGLDLPTIPNFHVFATGNLCLKWEKKSIMLYQS